MNDNLKTYLSFSNTEQRGIIGLVLIILFLFIGQLLLERHEAKQRSELQYTLLAETALEGDAMPNEETHAIEKPSIELFNFDPNTVSQEDMVKLGLSEKVAGTIINYREKGGKFYQATDLQKIYGLNAEDYERLAPFIVLKNELSNTNSSKPAITEQSSSVDVHPAVYPKKELNITLELNTADSSQLTSVYGIGPVYASRIVKYRNLLGGFVQKDQLLEVYGISPEVYEKIQEQIVCEVNVKPIKVHQAEWVDLKSHPYISSDLANLILNYIKSHGKMDSLGVLLDLDIIDKDDYQKLKPYLSFDE